VLRRDIIPHNRGIDENTNTSGNNTVPLLAESSGANRINERATLVRDTDRTDAVSVKTPRVIPAGFRNTIKEFADHLYSPVSRPRRGGDVVSVFL